MPFDNNTRRSPLGTPSSRRPYIGGRPPEDGILLPDSPGSRQCVKCKNFFALETLGKYKMCARCRSYNKTYYDRNVKKHRDSDVARRYGLSADQYQELQERHNDLCALCGQPETAKSRTGGSKSLAVDHDHATGKVRGLLCYRCNQLVAWLERYDWQTIERAWEYVQEHAELKD